MIVVLIPFNRVPFTRDTIQTGLGYYKLLLLLVVFRVGSYILLNFIHPVFEIPNPFSQAFHKLRYFFASENQKYQKGYYNYLGSTDIT